ncbi:MAG: DUF5753 domain-containing protein [Nocardiopsaceae bacterium]|nr:DUF5753 domain-containing protein [Nocardiopsaceae bacterium]
MQRTYSPSVRRRRLSKELRNLREAAGFTAAQAAKKLGWAQSKITKQEIGQTKTITTSDIDALLNLYKVTDTHKREALKTLAREAQERGWWAKFRDVYPGILPDFEAEASVIRTFEVQVIPGLLQTPEYAEGIFRGADLLDDGTINRRVESRMQRQVILNRHKPPTFQAVIDEAALRRTVSGRTVMREQIEHLCHMAVRHNISLYVLPFSAGAHAGTAAPFTILDFPGPLDQSIVYVEAVTNDLYLEETEDLDRYNVVYGKLQNSAMSLPDSVAFLRELARSLE